MIEGVLRHCTEMVVDRQYTDTHGASIVGFSFAHMPRLQADAEAEEFWSAGGTAAATR
ncbi:Tn3 family transposase [Streptomyces shenzhenensis]|uniref:Tn3 family transposase n=1 Tax=Streptomyces shenzhenensis TaxID=943815 RepID=UPI0037DA4C9D